MSSTSKKFAAAKSKRESSRKKMKTHKDNTDNALFVKDYKDFMMNVNKSLNSEADVTKVRNNLYGALKRINKLKKKLERYILVKTGSYYTSKVPKLCYSTQDRPAYYKYAKFENKNKSIPYDLEVRVVVRKIRLSIYDKVSGKQVYKSGSVNFDSDTYNKFFKNLLKVVFSGVEIPMKKMNDIFYQSKGLLFGSADSLSADNNVSSVISMLFANRDYYDEISTNIISSTLKALMYGGVNRTTDAANIKYFSSKDFFQDFTSRSITSLFSKDELFNMLYNLSLAYSHKYYKRSKTKIDLEVIACIRANIISIIRIMNLSNINDDGQDNYASSFDNSGNLNSMDISSNSPDDEINPTTIRPKLSDEVTDNYDPFGNVGKRRKLGALEKEISTTATYTRPTSIQSAGNNTYQNSSFGGKPIELTCGSNSIIKNSNAVPRDVPSKNLIDTMTDKSNILPPSSTVLYQKAGFNVPPGNDPYKPSDFFTFPSYNAPSDGSNPFNVVTPSFVSSNSDYSSNVPSAPTGVNNITTFIDQLTNLFGILHMAVYHLVELFTSGQGANIPQLGATFNALLNRSGLKQSQVPFVDKTRMSMVFSELESSINKLVNEGSIKKASHKIDIKSKDLFQTAIKELENLIPKESKEVKQQLAKATRSIKNYIEGKTNVGNLEMLVSLENTENQSMDTPDVMETNATITSLSNLKELVSIVSQMLPIPEGSAIGSSMMDL